MTGRRPSSAVLRARADLATVELDGELVIYDEREDTLHLLNPTATAIWWCLDGSATFDELVADLDDVFDADHRLISGDLADLLDDLADRGLLAGVPAAPGSTGPDVPEHQVPGTMDSPGKPPGP